MGENTMNHITACLTLFGISTIWASSFPVLRSTLGEMPPFTLLFWRFFLAFLCLTPWLIRSYFEGKKPGGAPVSTKLAPLFGLALGTCLGGAVMLQTLGTAITSASRAAFINTFSVVLAPILMFLGARVLPRRLAARLQVPRLDPPLVLGLCVALAGLLLIVVPGTGGGGTSGGGGTALLGNSLLTSSTLGLAAHMLIVQMVPPGANPLALCALQFGWVSLLCLAAALGAGQPIFMPLPWLPLAYLALVATALANAIQVRVQPQVTTLEAAAIYALQPATAALLSWFFLGENPRTTTLWGGGVLVFGILVMQVLPALVSGMRTKSQS